MKKLLALALTFGLAGAACADPKADKAAFQGYYQKLFPKIEFQEFANGVYAIDPALREQWESIEELPPYEIDVDEGKALYQASNALKNCFPNADKGIAQRYPYFDQTSNQVITLPLAINQCLEKAGEKTLGYKRGKLAKINGYFAYQSRGKIIDVKIPNDDALAAYEKGKRFFYARRGQLNLACAHCHVDNAGKRIRADLLSPALGHVSHFPVYRSKWGGLGTLHRRFAVCNEQVRAKAFPAQSEEYRNLEYFLSYMSNGIKLNGPGSRK